MSKYKTYEYIWLDGYEPEPFMRSKVKATDADTPPDWSFDGSSTQQAEGEVQIAFFFQFKHMKTQMVTTWL